APVPVIEPELPLPAPAPAPPAPEPLDAPEPWLAAWPAAEHAPAATLATNTTPASAHSNRFMRYCPSAAASGGRARPGRGGGLPCFRLGGNRDLRRLTRRGDVRQRGCQRVESRDGLWTSQKFFTLRSEGRECHRDRRIRSVSATSRSRGPS